MAKQRAIKRTKKFQSIRSKIMTMGALSIIAALILGIVGISSMQRIVRNNKVVENANAINTILAKNEANEAYYQYYIDQSYLDSILSYLDEMTDHATTLQKNANRSLQESIQTILNDVSTCKQNYEKIVQISNERGYDGSIGNYSEFLSSVQALSDSFTNLVNDNDWMELPWVETVVNTNAHSVTIGGKKYAKLPYDLPLPINVKRDFLAVRVGGTFTYKKSYYITDLQLTNGKKVQDIDVSKVKDVIKAGDGTANCEVVSFQGKPAIKVDCKFNASRQVWEESTIQLPISEFNIQDYKNVKYTIYFEAVNDIISLRYGGSINGLYNYNGKVTELTNLMSNYSNLVVEGKDTAEAIAQIDDLLKEISNNIPLYTSDKKLAAVSAKKMEPVQKNLETLKAADEQMTELKKSNSELNEDLRVFCDKIQSSVTADSSRNIRNATYIIILVLLAITAILFFITLVINRKIVNNVKNFQTSLDKIANGNIAVRIKQDKQDEFSLFGDSINVFLDNLQGTIQKVKELTMVLATSGNTLEDKANQTNSVADMIGNAINDISTGASEQASEIEDSSSKVITMCTNVDGIITSVNALSNTMNDMVSKAVEASQIMNELSESNDLTTTAFGKIADQIRKTNDSVVKIQEVVNLIASIASQTNLLSLNASIEAARAGEAGRGFAVVASEIQNLSEQTNTSAGIINQIIVSLSDESQKTVQSINDVTTMIYDQKNKLDHTKEQFTSVSSGIASTETEMKGVLTQAASCSSDGKHVVDIMTALSSIAEENAASTEQTNSSMVELNDTTISLAKTAQELKKLSDALNQDLAFFTTE